MPLNLFPLDPEDRLTYVERRPADSLCDYLVRCQWELVGRVRLLASVRDGWIATLDRERIRWRRSRIVLLLAQALGAGAGYAALDGFALAEAMPALAVAGLIGLAALLGGLLAIGLSPGLVKLAERPLPGRRS
jgi:hypothetical protein